MNTNATKNTPKAAEKGRKQAAAEQAAKKDKTNTTKTTKTAEQAERKEEKTMKTKNTNAAAKTAPKTEQTAATKTEDRRAAKIAALLEAAKTANTPNARKQAAEQAAALILQFNNESFANAVNRADMTKAAEALKPNAPKKDESRRAGFAYANAENIITFQFIDEDGHESTKRLSLVQYAAAAFMKTATKEQNAAFCAALAELEKVTAAAIDGKQENGKTAAAALTALSAACGLEAFTTKTAEDGKKYPFFIDRSFVYAAAAPLRVKRGEVMTAAARLEAANVAAFAAAANKRTKAEERREKAEAAAVKAVFGIIAAAAEAAAVNVWKAHTKTAEDVRAEAAAAAEAATKREQAKKDSEAKKAEREAKTAAAKREKAAKLREQAAALEAAADKQTAAEAKTAAA